MVVVDAGIHNTNLAIISGHCMHYIPTTVVLRLL